MASNTIEPYTGNPAELVPGPGQRLGWTGLAAPAFAHALARALRLRPAVYLVVLPQPAEAEAFLTDMALAWPEGEAQGRLMGLPGYEVRPFGGQDPNREHVFARLGALYALMNGQAPLVVAGDLAACLQLSPPPEVLGGAAELIETGQELDRAAFIEHLVQAGYSPVSLVQAPAELSVRGDILDFYPPGEPHPVRAEFFGDQVESLRRFSVFSQRSTRTLDHLEVLPASEVILTPRRAREGLGRLRELADRQGWPGRLAAPLEEALDTGSRFAGLEHFAALFYGRLASALDYAPPHAIVAAYEPERAQEAAGIRLAKVEAWLAEAAGENRPRLPLENLYAPPERLAQALARGPALAVDEQSLAAAQPLDRRIMLPSQLHPVRAALGQAGEGPGGLFNALARAIEGWLARSLAVYLVVSSPQQLKRLTSLLENHGLSPRAADQPPGEAEPGLYLVQGSCSAGFLIEPLGCVFITEDELFGARRRSARRAAPEVEAASLSSFQDLAEGDYVVHADHGVGQYLGLTKLEAGGLTNDYLLLAYRDNDKLYVPVDRFSQVQKYIGRDAAPPGLDKLGGAAWEKLKGRVKAEIKEMAQELARLYAQRQVRRGHSFGGRDGYFEEFEAAFKYEETADQLAAINEVLADMASEKPMDRLVSGDVGFGKTEVALRAAFRAVLDGKQVAVLVPTTVLAMQHFQTFSERLAPYPVRVEVLSRFKTKAQQAEIVREIGQGRVDVVVGTHRLLSQDVEFKDLGLLVLDEEHRFGVRQKEKLKKLKTQVDALAMSATPIPRTLQMSLSGIRDLSTIQTPPADRSAIKSFLLKYDEAAVCEAIDFELGRGGQVFFVHNRVRDIHALAARYAQLMPLVRFGVAHGQMKERELETVMLAFMNRELDVLVTTAIIESGLDIPSANTIIINNADRFGLAQIYQLRGRVGRASVTARAYLMVRTLENLSTLAQKRLKVLMSFSDLGSGYKIALHDLQLRGSGNLLGAAQSGQIAALGYEMYVKLMEQALQEVRGQKMVEEIEPEIVLNLPAYIPESYVADTEQRLIHYRAFSSVKNLEELDALMAELLDRYGAIPDETQNLERLIELKLNLKEAGVRKMELGGAGMTLTFAPEHGPDPARLVKFVQEHKDQARLHPDGRLFVPMRVDPGPERLRQARNILIKLI